ncbi:MAG: ferritin family protein [Nitrospirota bacterium]|jgi:rubrerythrin
MASFSVREVVEMAIQTERLGYAFYEEMAGRFPDHKGLKDLFTTLAKKEHHHEQVFTDLLGKIKDAPALEGWEEAQPYFRAMVESEFFLGDKKALPSMDRVGTVAEAADFALGFEKETLLFFVGLRQGVREKDVVEDIIEEEMSHIVWLKEFKESL